MRLYSLGRAAFFAALLTIGCGSDDPASAEKDPVEPVATGGADSGPAVASDFDATETDFECLQSWDPVRSFRVTNKLGHGAEALAVANAGEGMYPVGTIIQLVPTEAMVKRGPEYSPESNNWEFFELRVSASGTSINVRGGAEVVNQFGGSCFDCHSKAEPRFDFVCETSNGCDPLPLPTSFLVGLQDSDPRCP